MNRYDYVIVGAGTAGCVIAARLSEDPTLRVLLIEAGQRDTHWSIRIPSAIGRNYQSGPFNWGFLSTPQKHLNNRVVVQARGKVLGGSSSVNGMVYLRGHALDFERWVQEGAAGWSYAEVLPYFRRMERFTGGTSEYRGDTGPVVVRKGTTDHPINEAFVRAGDQAGHGLTDDVNGFRQDGFGSWNMNIDQGMRASSARAYLRGAAERSNLTVLTEAFATQVLFDGDRATSVEYRHGGALHRAEAEREIVLSAGGIKSPHLLMLSGIGPADHLREHGIGVRVDAPDVGRNVQDHMYLMLQYESKENICLNPHARGWRMVMAGARWFATRSGPAASNHIEVGAFFRSNGQVSHPDSQIHFRPLLLDPVTWLPSKVHGYNFGVGPLRPTSMGSVTLASADPYADPIVDPNHLGTEKDRADFRTQFKMTREVGQQAAFDRFRKREVGPSTAAQTDAEIDAFIRAYAHSAWHNVGACRMGSDARAVVSPDLKVNGVRGLRVADTSAMPSMISANTNCTTFMLGERATDIIRGGPMLAPLNLPFYRG
ncbi:MAG: choline dehydrogenase [Alphaproteobacteria bacterium]|nr:choline dehydrogenase [Alphaproteobacteria bacterium]